MGAKRPYADQHGNVPGSVRRLVVAGISQHETPQVAISEMVAAADAKHVVLLHAETERILQDVAMLVAAFSGDGHA